MDAVKVDLSAPGLAVVVVARQATVRDVLLWAQENGGGLAGRSVQIFCDDPAVTAALAWALKPWLRPEKWAVNGRAIGL